MRSLQQHEVEDDFSKRTLAFGCLTRPRTLPFQESDCLISPSPPVKFILGGMTRPQKIGLGCLLTVLIAVALLRVVGYLLTRDFSERRAVLQPLLATNAPLQVVTAHVGQFVILRPGTADWNQVLSQYRRGSKWDRHIAAKMERASAVGHTSTIDMQTWIFLDDEDRLIGFELGTQ